MHATPLRVQGAGVGGVLPLEVFSEAGRPCVGRGAEGGGIPDVLDARRGGLGVAAGEPPALQ